MGANLLDTISENSSFTLDDDLASFRRGKHVSSEC